MDFQGKWRGLAGINLPTCAHGFCPNDCSARLSEVGSCFFCFGRTSLHPSLGHKGYVPLPRICSNHGRGRTNGKVALARRMFADKSNSIQEICSTLEISRSTLYRYVKEVESPE